MRDSLAGVFDAAGRIDSAIKLVAINADGEIVREVEDYIPGRTNFTFGSHSTGRITMSDVDST